MQNKETKKTELAPKSTQKSALPYIVVSLIIVSLLLVGFFILKSQVNKVSFKSAKIGNSVYNLEVADTYALREKGLSQRDSLPNDGGMLFDFKAEGDWRIWMLQMRFPIDIVWLTKDGKVVFIKNNAQPGDYPEVYHADQLSWYAIELPVGTLEKQGVKVGDIIQVE